MLGSNVSLFVNYQVSALFACAGMGSKINLKEGENSANLRSGSMRRATSGWGAPKKTEALGMPLFANVKIFR